MENTETAESSGVVSDIPVDDVRTGDNELQERHESIHARDEENNQEEKTETQAVPQKFRVKAAGEEREVSLDELTRAYQRHEGWSQRLEQIKQQEAEIQQRYEFLQQNPLFAAALQGQDPYQIAQRLVWERMQEERLPPERRQALQAQRQAAELQAQIQALEGRRAALAAEQEARAASEYWTPIFQTAMDKAKVPVTEYTTQRILEIFKGHVEAYGVEDVSVDEVVAEAKKSLYEEYSSSLSNVDAERLIEWLGEDTARKVSQAFAKKLQKRNNVVPPLVSEREEEEVERKIVTEEDFMKEMRAFKNRG